MNSQQYFAYDSGPIPAEIILRLSEIDLDGLYASSDETGRFNVVFHLQNALLDMTEQGNACAAAKVCYLLSYYLFVALTLTHSVPLAKQYAKQALALAPCEKYRKWLEEVGEGN